MQYVFGASTLDVHREELRAAGSVVRLDRQVFAVLAYLVQHRDRVVPRQELFERLWSDRFVSEAALERCITVARRAVGDSGQTQQVIQTVRGRGYRFVTPVEERPGEAAHREVWAAPDGTTGLHEERWPAGLDTQEAERRQLTILVCQLVGVPEHAVPFDPEALVEVLPDYHLMCAEVVRRFSGHLAQDQRDGLVVVYFGYPQAQEDDACQAVYAGLEIVEAMRQFQVRRVHERGGRFAVRVGIHTGMVVMNAPDLRGAQGPLALGQTPTIAAQVQGVAPPDTVAVSPSTMRMVEGYVLSQALGTYLLDDAPEPQGVFQILQKRSVPSRFAAAAANGLTPFVGRKAELALLRQLWAQVQDGLGQMIMLSGEPGIGKSRLVQVLKDQLVQGPHVLWECHSSPHYQQTPLFPLMAFFPQVLQWLPEDSPAEKVVKLEHFLRQYRFPLQDTVPLFAALWSLPLPESHYPLLALSPQRQRQKTLESIVALMLAQAKQHPMLFVLEDLHWTDPTTLEFLSLLIEQTPTAAICAVLTCRPDFQPSWSHRTYLTEVTVHRLSRPQIAHMAEQVAGEKALPTEMVQQLVDKTDGVPLYVEEMTKTLLESGHLKEVDGHYALTGPMGSWSIPITLQDSLMARLDRLDSAKRVAQLGAVIGRQFEYTLLRAVWEQDETRLQQELDLLVKVELVYQQGIAPQATYVFKHVLIQEAAYQSLLRRTRRRYHQRIAQTLHTRFPDTAASQPELLAHHYTAAGLASEAVPYWQNAGWKALQSSAHQEAVAHFRKGLEVLSDLPETPERNRLELDLLIALGPALMATEGFSAPALIQTYSRAHELCQHMEATPQYTQALMGLWQFYLIRSELRKAQELASQLHRLAHQLPALTLLPTAYRTLGKTAVWQGDFSSARTFLEQGAAVYDPRLHRDHALRYGLDPGVVCLGSLAWSLWHLGYPDQARQKQHEALGLARELSHPFSLAFALCVAAMCFEWCGDLAAVRAYGDEAVALATEQRFPFWMAIGMGVSGFASVCLGQATEGIVQLRQGYDLYCSTGANAARLWFLNILTRAALQMNNLDEANAMSNAALVFMETTEERFSEVESYWLQGKLRLAQATSAHELQTWAPDIEACLVRAQRAARRRQMKSWELRIAIDLRELWQSQGRSDEAQRLLAEVYKTFTEGWDTADLQLAKALLAASP